MREPSSHSSYCQGFALFLTLGIIALLGAFFVLLDFTISTATRTSQLQYAEESARQNAWTALQIAINEIENITKDGCAITLKANAIHPNAPENTREWTGVWKNKNSQLVFERWLIPGTSANRFEAPTETIEQPHRIFDDWDLSDEVPLQPIQYQGDTVGHYTYFIEDESQKIRINLPEPNTESSTVAQHFGQSSSLWKDLSSKQKSTLIKSCFFSEWLTEMTKNSPENSSNWSHYFHTISLCSKSLFQNTSGEWLKDLTTAIYFANDTPKFLFKTDPNLPQPAPTLRLLRSYFEDIGEAILGESVTPRGCYPLYHWELPPVNDTQTLSSLLNQNSSLGISQQYGIYPVFLGFYLSTSVQLNGKKAQFRMEPHIVLWNPYNITLKEHTYTFCLQAANPQIGDQTMVLPGFFLRIQNRTTRRILSLGEEATGKIFQMRFSTSFAPGEIQIFSLDSDTPYIGGILSSAQRGDYHHSFIAELPLPQTSISQPTYEILRQNPNSWDMGWDNLSLQLYDHDGSLLQEVTDIIDSDNGNLYLINDEENHFLFTLYGHANIVADGELPLRWIADHNLRAPQIRRTAYEHDAIIGEIASNFHRQFPIWPARIAETTNYDQLFSSFEQQHMGQSVILFDLPRALTSIATLQHLNLHPFSYTPSNAVGNSWATPLLPSNLSFALAGKSNSSLFRHEMRQDLSYLLNEGLYDHYFVSGFSPQALKTESSEIPYTSNLEIIGKPTFETLKDSEESAHHLYNLGALNIHCTRADIWELFLRSALAEENKMGYGFRRFSSHSNATETALSEEEIHRLAEEIATCTKERLQQHGPFHSLSEWINHEKEGTLEERRYGLLQRAIQRSGILNAQEQLPVSKGNLPNHEWFIADYAAGDQNDGLPERLTSADILQFLGNSLCLRGDTFSVRTYGDFTDRNGNIRAKAQAEAILQRTPSGKIQLLAFRWISPDD